MQLAEALGVRQGDLVAFVGAGGKSTAMRRLAAQVVERGWRVAVTTTTRIRSSEGYDYPQLVVAEDLAEIVKRARAALRTSPPCVAVARRSLRGQGKLAGIPKAWTQALLEIADVVLVEADGARGRSLKAPAPHEPAMPPATSLVVPLLGLDALGHEIDSPFVHRPERVAAILGAPSQTELSPADMARVILHPEGQAKGVPADARYVPLLNKTDIPQHLPLGRQVAWLTKGAPLVDAILLGALVSPEPILERWDRSAAVVLAAGQGRRYGGAKQLAPLGGKPLLHHVLDAALESSLDEVCVVLGAYGPEIENSLRPYQGRERLHWVHNPQWPHGLSTSLRVGLDALRGHPAAVMFLLGDQPFVSVHMITQLLTRRAQTMAPIVAPSFQGQRGNPVLFGRELFGELASVTGDQGGRTVVEQHANEAELVEMATPHALRDVDTPADYARALDEGQFEKKE